MNVEDIKPLNKDQKQITESLKTNVAILQLLGYLIIVIGLFLPWYVDGDSQSYIFYGFELVHFNMPFVICSSLILIGVMKKRPLISSLFGTLPLSLAIGAVIFSNHVFGWTWGQICPMCLWMPPNIVWIGPGLYMALFGAFIVVLSGILIWYFEQARSPQRVFDCSSS